MHLRAFSQGMARPTSSCRLIKPGRTREPKACLFSVRGCKAFLFEDVAVVQSKSKQQQNASER